MSVVNGSIVISIDLELDLVQRSDLGRQRALADVTGRLVRLCSAYRTPATWAVADPAISAATDAIRAGQLPHEIALLGDSAWVNSAGCGLRFARELNRRIMAAQTAGLAVTTLALRGLSIGREADTVRHSGLTALRRNLTEVVSGTPHTRQFGLRAFAVQATLPVAGGWWSQWRQLRRLRRAIDDTARLGGLLHLGIDAPALAAIGPHSLRQVQRLLKHIRHHASAGRLTIETIAAATSRINRTHPHHPATSILRAA